jgi:hypothetical protein
VRLATGFWMLLCAGLPAGLVALLTPGCSSDDSAVDASQQPEAAAPDAPAPPPPADGGPTAEAAPPPPACDVIADASFPDAYYPSTVVACTKAGDPCALPPNECVFDRYRVRYTKGYCSSSLNCVFTYVRELCSGAEPVGCEAGVCTCAPK